MSVHVLWKGRGGQKRARAREESQGHGQPGDRGSNELRESSRHPGDRPSLVSFSPSVRSLFPSFKETDI